MNLKVEKSECIKTRENIGVTEYINICNGKHYSVSWGSDTWLGVVVLTIFIITFFAMMVSVIKDCW